MKTPLRNVLKFGQNYVQNLVTIGHSGKKRIKDYKMDIKPSEFHY
jgi:hypothetical protein